MAISRPSMRGFLSRASGPVVIAYSELADLGIPHAANYPTANQSNYYRRNAFSMFEFGGRLYVGAGHAGGVTAITSALGSVVSAMTPGTLLPSARETCRTTHL